MGRSTPMGAPIRRITLGIPHPQGIKSLRRRNKEQQNEWCWLDFRVHCNEQRSVGRQGWRGAVTIFWNSHCGIKLLRLYQEQKDSRFL